MAHLHDDDGLKGVDTFLSELPLGAVEPFFDVHLHDVIEVVEGTDEG